MDIVATRTAAVARHRAAHFITAYLLTSQVGSKQQGSVFVLQAAAYALRDKFNQRFKGSRPSRSGPVDVQREAMIAAARWMVAV